MNAGSILGGISKAFSAVAPLAAVLGPPGLAISAGLGMASTAMGVAQEGVQQADSQSKSPGNSPAPADSTSMGFTF